MLRKKQEKKSKIQERECDKSTANNGVGKETLRKGIEMKGEGGRREKARKSTRRRWKQ